MKKISQLLLATLSTVVLAHISAADVDLAQAHQLLVVDNSGSMGGNYEWIGELALQIEAKGKGSSKFGLMEFSKNTRPIALDGKSFGNAAQFDSAVRQLAKGSGAEDGYQAIDEVIAQYSVGKLFAPHIILITDEHRTPVNRGVDIHSISSRLAQTQLPITAIVAAGFICDDQRRALGMDAQGMGILLESTGKLSRCTIAKVIETRKNSHSVTDYVDLALSTGGSVWDMDFPRSMRANSTRFARVFAEVHSTAITRDVHNMEVIPKVSFASRTVRVGDVVTFDASASRTVYPDAYINSIQWDFNSDHQVDADGHVVAHIFGTPGTHDVSVSMSTSDSSKTIESQFQIKVIE